MTAAPPIEVSFYRLSEALRPFFTALYLFEIADGDGVPVQDCLHPEWAAMRFTQGTPPVAAIGRTELVPQWPFVVSGPNKASIIFRLGPARIWGLGLLPAGWARFVDGKACDFADRTVDGMTDPAFRVFAPLLAMTQDSSGSSEAIARRINAYLMAQLGHPSPHEPLITACHAALRDAEVTNVAQLGERLGLSARSLERLCGRYFGFPPKLLLRRQRLLRSLARFMLDPYRGWSQAIDRQYHDQAQFVRDFRAFMGMTPSEYADMPHPVMDKIMAHRMIDQGAVRPADLPVALHYTCDLQHRSE
jgi:AraC-like DNA-binding protein